MKLPENRREKVISDLEVGEYGYVTPWAMCIASDKECYMKTNLAVQSRSFGDFKLKIKRVYDGYIAFINEIKNYVWPVLGDYELDFGDQCISPVISFEEESSKRENNLSEMPFHNLSTEELKKEMGKAAAFDNFERAVKIRNYLNSKSISN